MDRASNMDNTSYKKFFPEMYLLVQGEHWRKQTNQEEGMSRLKIRERLIRTVVKSKMDSLISLKKELEDLEQKTSRVPRKSEEPVLGKRSARKLSLEPLEVHVTAKSASAKKSHTASKDLLV